MLRGPSDERLVARVRRGDERAFELLYDRHHRALLAFCRHMLGSREEAEDALQHVFISAHRHLRSASASGRGVQLKPWLYAIARNRCLSMLRARRDAIALDAVAPPSTDGLAVASEVERRQELRDTLADVAQLPDDQRAALVLAELGDLSHAEIAETLEVRTDKVKALVFQAREALAGRREARLADCREIQEQLATLRGSALRRGPLARHVEVCPACAAFKAEVARQRKALALLLPVVPTVALREGVLSAVVGGGGAAISSGVAAKVAAVVVVAAGAGGGGAVAVRELHAPQPRAAAVAPAAVTPASARPGDAERGDEPAERSPGAQASPGEQARGKAKARGRGSRARGRGKAKALGHAKPKGRAAAKRKGRGGAKATAGRAKPGRAAPAVSAAPAKAPGPPANVRGKGASKRP